MYCCAGHPDTGLEFIAAKVYRPRMLRNLRNDARYRQSRVILDDAGKEVKDHGYLHAIEKGTEVGKNLLHTSWLEHEYTTLQSLYAAGVHVPRPVACGYNTVLMAYIGDADLAALIEHLVRLPGVGPKTAQRLAFHLLKAPREDAAALAEALVALKDRTRLCQRCFNLCESELCGVCLDARRDGTLLCVVEEINDLLAIEKTRALIA